MNPIRGLKMHKLNVCYKKSKKPSAARIPRLWLEGSQLSAANWSKGDRFNITPLYVKDKVHKCSKFKLIKDHDGSRKVSGKIKGNGYSPVIDITGKAIQFINGADHLHIEYTPKAITIIAHY